MTATICVGDELLPARYAESTLSRLRGHMFRRRTPGYALVFLGSTVRERSLHMVGVPFALEALFVVDGVVDRVAELAPWTGTASGEAETVVEVPPGLVDAEAGMEVTLDA